MIYNEDCFSGLSRIDDKSIDLIVTDPPYWHHKSPGRPYSERSQSNTKSKFAQSELYNAEGSMMSTMSDFTDKDISRFLDIAERKMKKMNAYMFCSEAQVPYYCLWAEEHGYMFSILVWEKPLSIINKNRFSQNVEYVVRIYDYGTALNRVDINHLYNRVDHSDPVTHKEHPTQKPLSLIEKFVLLSSKEGDTILDPFMGSGTTGVVTERNNRNFIGFEIEQKFYEIAKKRLDENTRQLTLW